MSTYFLSEQQRRHPGRSFDLIVQKLHPLHLQRENGDASSLRAAARQLGHTQPQTRDT